LLQGVPQQHPQAIEGMQLLPRGAMKFQLTASMLLAQSGMIIQTLGDFLTVAAVPGNFPTVDVYMEVTTKMMKHVYQVLSKVL
jgi:hypothetical protein